MSRDDYFVLVYQILAYLYTCLKEGQQADPDYLKPDSPLNDAPFLAGHSTKGLNLTTEELELCKNLDSALGKMPKYNGNLSRSVFFYSDDELETFVERFHLNREISFKEYISTTRGTETYNPEGQAQIFISNATKGHDISMINGAEQEVLYDRNTFFYVVNKVYRKGKWYILLEEL